MTLPVLIVGAGIGGLTLAHALTRAGIQFQLIEKVATWRPVGAGLILSSNALDVLQRLGLADAALQVGHPLASVCLTNAAGRPIQTMSYQADGGAVALHRAQLQTVLRQGVEQHLRLGTTVQDLRQHSQGIEVTLSDGSRQQFSAVVGADGLHSAVRELAFGNLPKRYAGYTSWRFVVSASAPPHAVEMWGRGRRFGIVPLAEGRVYGYVTANAPEAQPNPPTDRVAGVKARCAEFGGPAPQLLARLVAGTPIIHTDIHEVRLRHWVQGRVALLGDAAHAMTPNLGQGAAMSMEDAWVLGRQLASASATAVPEALARYEERRRDRVNRVQLESRRLGQAGQMNAGGLRTLRDLGMRLLPPGLAHRSTRWLFEPEL